VAIDPIHWFLNDTADPRCRSHLMAAATEREIQGLELDWFCMTWDADLRMRGQQWRHHSRSSSSCPRVTRRTRPARPGSTMRRSSIWRGWGFGRCRGAECMITPLVSRRHQVSQVTDEHLQLLAAQSHRLAFSRVLEQTRGAWRPHVTKQFPDDFASFRGDRQHLFFM